MGPLADNGGPTLTHLPQSGSSAIDIGGTCGPEDQRSFDAPQDGDASGGAECDAGAVERQQAADVAIDLTATATSPLTVAPGGEVAFAYTLTNPTGAPFTGDLYFLAERADGTPARKGRIRSGTLPAGATVSGTFTQQVPTNAPLATYTYRLIIGAFSSVVVDEEAFAITVPRPRSGGLWPVAALRWSGARRGRSCLSPSGRSRLPW